LTNHAHPSRQLALTAFFYHKFRESSLFSNAFFLMLNNVTTSLLGFVFWNIMARVFSPEQVGIGSALVAASGLIAVLSNMGLGVGLIRFIPEVKDRVERLINSSFTLSGGLAVVGSLIYLGGIRYWSPVLGFVAEDLWFLPLFVVFTVVTALSVLTDQSLVAGRSARYVFFKNTFNSLVKLPMPILFFAYMGGFGIFAATGVGFLLANLLSWFFYLPSVYKGYLPRPAYESDLVRRMLPYSFANYLANLLNGAPNFIYPLMVINLLGPEKNAYFYIAWMMTMVLSVIPNGLAQSLLAEGVYDQRKLAQNGRRALAFSLVLSLPAVGAMFLLGGWLLHFFGTGYAENGTGLMQYLALAVFPQCVNVLYITVNQVKKRVYLIIAQTAVLAVISLGLGYWLLGRVGLNGIGIAYALAHLVVAAGVVLPLWRALREGKVETLKNSKYMM